MRTKVAESGYHPQGSPPHRSEDNTRYIKLSNSVIKGYHVYRIRPPVTNPPTRLRVDREYTNIKDVNACLVWIPELNSFPQHLHKLVTDTKRSLYLDDVADLPIGHVPRSLAGFFRNILDSGGSVFAEVIGDPTPSFPPWPRPDEEGGGVVLPADYFIYCGETGDRQGTVSALQRLLDSLAAGSVMTIS